jgi:hypothetical protein
LDDPLTLAVNTCAPPEARVADVGRTEIAIAGFGVFDPDEEAMPTHPARLKIAVRSRPIAAPRESDKNFKAGVLSRGQPAFMLWGKARVIALFDARQLVFRGQKEECPLAAQNPRYRKCIQALYSTNPAQLQDY